MEWWSVSEGLWTKVCVNRVLDHDTYSSHDASGKVYIDLKPLLNSYDAPSSISGWVGIDHLLR